MTDPAMKAYLLVSFDDVISPPVHRSLEKQQLLSPETTAAFP
jgi:hypothetical protein